MTAPTADGAARARALGIVEDWVMRWAGPRVGLPTSVPIGQWPEDLRNIELLIEDAISTYGRERRIAGKEEALTMVNAVSAVWIRLKIALDTAPKLAGTILD